MRRTIHRIRPMAVNTLRLWLSAAVLLPLPGRAAALAHTPAAIWALCAAAAVLGPLLSRLLLMVGLLRHITAGRAAQVLMSQPLFAYLLAALVFGTTPTLPELAGCAAILAGIALHSSQLTVNKSESLQTTASLCPLPSSSRAAGKASPPR